MFALEPGTAGANLRVLGQSLPQPSAIVILSPHWMTRGEVVHVCAVAAPRTIHDFGGFDPKLYTLHYPAPGEPALAQRIRALLNEANIAAITDDSWGLDHGAWVPLMHLFPRATIPVVPISMPHRATPEHLYAVGKALTPLAEDDVLLIGSGSLTHNLFELQTADGAPAAPYAAEFDAWVRAAVARGDETALIDAMNRAPHAKRAHPTAEHWLPLVFALGAAKTPTPAQVLDGGILYGVLSMTSFVFGALG
jgi:4,5-DOPA dioxygenase extradiol